MATSDAISWQDNATLYRYENIEGDYSVAVMVFRNPYNGEWVWSVTAKRIKGHIAVFHEFGEKPTVDGAKMASMVTLGIWRANRD